MAKIKVSTVRQMADVQVINVNARLVSKATRASVMLRSILDRFATVDQILKAENPCAGIEAVEVCTSVCEFLDELTEAFESDEKEDKKKD